MQTKRKKTDGWPRWLSRRVRLLWRAPLAHREAVRLAQVMWRRSYRDAAPHWQPLDDTAGVISQIDNMHAGVVEENEKLRDLLAHLQHHTSCTSLQFDLIEEALKPNNVIRP